MNNLFGLCLVLSILLPACAPTDPPELRIHWLHTEDLGSFGRSDVGVNAIYYNLDADDQLWELRPNDFRVVMGNDELPPSRYSVAFVSPDLVEVRFTRPLDTPAHVTLAAMIAVEPCLADNGDPGLRSISRSGYRGECWMD